MSNADRFFCPLQPCLPVPLEGGRINDEIIRGSRSFATFEGYQRHIEQGHFIAKDNAPQPYMTADAAMRRYLEDGR